MYTNKPSTLRYVFCVVLFCISSFTSIGQETRNNKTRDSLLSQLQQSQDLEKVSVLLELNNHYSPNQLEEGLKVAKQALDLSRSLNDSTSVMKSLMAIGENYRLKGKYDSLKIALDEALPLALLMKDDEAIFLTHNNMASYHERIGDMTKALAFSNKALQYCNEKDKYKIFNNQGRIHDQLGNVSKSIELYEMAIQEAIKQGNKNAEAVISNNIGALYVNIRQSKKATDYYLKALKIKKEIGDKRGQLYSLMNLADQSIYDKKNEDYSNAGMAIARELKDERFISIFTVLQSRKFLKENRFQEGLDLLLPIYNDQKDQPSLEYTYIIRAIAELYIEKGDFINAEKFALKIKSLGEQNKNLETIQSGRGILVKVYANNKNATQYLEIAKDYYQIRDSIEDQQFVDNFAIMEANLDKEQTEKIALLNDAIVQKTNSRNRMGLAALLLTLLLGSLLYFRAKLAKAQETVILQKKESLALLEEKNKILQENTEIKTRFYANVSHEFRTPLTLIMGPLNQLIDRSNDASQIKILEGALKHSNKLLNMVNQLLDLAKIESNHLRLDIEKHEFISFSRELFKSFETIFDSMQMEMNYDTNVDKVDLWFDIEKMEVILFNILSNAFKYTPRGGVISMSVLGEEERIKVIISDSGRGINSKDIPYLFDRFFRVENSKENSAEGSGIGLSLAKDLVDLQHGTISVSSVVGSGTSFILTFQKGQDHFLNEIDTQDLEDKVSSSTNIELLANVSLKENHHLIKAVPIQERKATILIVEDNKDVLEYIKSTLDNQFNILEAEDGQLGLDLATSHLPELIISDVMMPVMDGFEFCKNVKQKIETSHIPVILLTARVETENKITGLELGADDYLVKPFHPKELNVRVRNLINSRIKLRQRFLDSPTLQLKSVDGNPIENKFIKNIGEILESNLGNSNFGVDILALEIGLSKSQVNRKIKAITDMTTNKFIQYKRLNKALVVLQTEDRNVSEVCYSVGFSSVAYFVKCFKDQFGKTPGSIKKTVA